jgi:hypothetical protein
LPRTDDDDAHRVDCVPLTPILTQPVDNVASFTTPTTVTLTTPVCGTLLVTPELTTTPSNVTNEASDPRLDAVTTAVTPAVPLFPLLTLPHIADDDVQVVTSIELPPARCPNDPTASLQIAPTIVTLVAPVRGSLPRKTPLNTITASYDITDVTVPDIDSTPVVATTEWLPAVPVLAFDCNAVHDVHTVEAPCEPPIRARGDVENTERPTIVTLIDPVLATLPPSIMEKRLELMVRADVNVPATIPTVTMT